MDAAHTLYQQGREAMAAGQFEEAVTLFTQSITISPHFKPLELLGECLINIGKLQEAVVPLAAATTLNAGVRAPALLAEVFLRLNQFVDADYVAEIALQRHPGNKLALSVKQALLDLRNRWDSCERGIQTD
jgi:Flp pilus assembly protein TadD